MHKNSRTILKLLILLSFVSIISTETNADYWKSHKGFPEKVKNFFEKKIDFFKKIFRKDQKGLTTELDSNQNNCSCTTQSEPSDKTTVTYYPTNEITDTTGNDFVQTTTQSRLTSSEYIIDNGKCRIPHFPVFSKETKPLYEKKPYVDCGNEDLLTNTTVENNIAYLYINEESISQYNVTLDSLECCYTYVTEEGSQDGSNTDNSLFDCKYFKSPVALTGNTVWVRCYCHQREVYQNVHTTITVTDTVQQKMENLTNKKDSCKKPLSVLLIVIDSISRLNFHRTLPLTKKFIRKNNFIEFSGYNNVDEGTMPNFNALLNGYNLNQSEYYMIWYDYNNAGYATAFAEDWFEMTTTNNLEIDFQNSPIDYYFKSYTETVKRLNITIVDEMPFCAGPESQGERILNIAKDFSTTFKGKPSFSIFWMNSFSQLDINTPTRMDEYLEAFFKDLKDKGILDDSMVVLLSDHGVKVGEIVNTIQGWFELRLPMNFISIPPWFQQNYPKKYKNLQENANKLTSTYDFYMTLQDVLSSSVEDYYMVPSRACSDCRSFFSKIPEERSCQEAGIPEKWCGCKEINEIKEIQVKN